MIAENPMPLSVEVSDSDDTTEEGEVTRLLRAGREGEEELWPIIYGELKRLARSALRGRRREAQTTTLVHEAYLRLSRVEGGHWKDRQHFYTTAARAMRYVLVDQTRRRLAGKRGEGKADLPLPAAPGDTADPPADPAPACPPRLEAEILAVHQALDRLGEVNPRHVKLVELRYFSGFTVDETAELLGVSRPTVVRDWRAVRTWLHATLARPETA